MLLLLLAGNLPIPLVHSHDVANGTRQLALHVALFHPGRCHCDPHRVHVHIIPASFLGGLIGGGATGDDAPAPERDNTCPPELAQVDVAPSLDLAVMSATDQTVIFTDRATLPRHFLATYPTGCDLGGLWGVCRC
jgi:hypothetical protein